MNFLLFIVASGLFFTGPQKPFQVTGIVKDEYNEPIPFATIIEVGTENRIKSNSIGFFKMKVRGNKAVLLFKVAGYKSKEIQINEQKVIKVNLSLTDSTDNNRRKYRHIS